MTDAKPMPIDSHAASSNSASNKSRPTLLRRLSDIAFFATLAFAPSGTRLIFRMGEIGSMTIEPGTASLYAMQLCAIAFVALEMRHAGVKAFFAPAGRAIGAIPAALTLWTMLAAAASPDVRAWIAAAWVMLGFLTYLAVLSRRPDPRYAAGIFFGMGIFHALIGLPQFLLQYAPSSTLLGMASHDASELGAFVIETADGRWLRAYGAMPHPNPYGFVVGIGLLAAAAFVAKSSTPRKQLYSLAIVPLLAAGLFVAFSRGAWIAFCAGAAVLAIAALQKKGIGLRRSFRLWAAAGAAAACFFAAVFVDPLVPRLTGDGRLESNSIDERISSATDAVTLAATHPLFGVGPGLMPYAIVREIDPLRPAWKAQPAHLVPLLVAAEAGLPAAFAWLAFAAILLLAAVRAAETADPFSAALGGFFVVVFVASLTDHFFWSLWPGQLLFWLIAGLLIGVKKNAPTP